MRWIVLAVIWFLNGCAVVSTTNHSGVEESRVIIGPLAHVVSPGSSQLGNVRAIGFTRTPLGFTFGWVDQQFVIDDENCRLVVWIEDDVQAEALRAKLQLIEDACVQKEN